MKGNDKVSSYGMEQRSENPYVLVDDYFVNWADANPIIYFPRHVQDIIYELALNYLIAKPADSLEYSLKFLKDLRESNKIDIELEYSRTDSRSTAAVSQRRKSIFGRSFELRELESFDETSETVCPKTEEDKARLKTTLQAIVLFKNLDEDEMSRVIDAMFIKTVSKGDVVIQQGDDGDFFYVVQSGVFNALRTKGTAIFDLCRYANSGYFGELALLYNQPRAASVVALTDGILWALGRDTFQRIVLSSSFKKSQRYESMIDKVPILMNLDRMEKMKLADSLVPVEYQEGEEIIRQGDAGEGMYFIESGSVRVQVEERGRAVPVRDLGEGEYFGELALLTQRPRAASVVASGRVKAAYLGVEAFERLLGPCVALMKRNIPAYEAEMARALGSDPLIS